MGVPWSRPHGGLPTPPLLPDAQTLALLCSTHQLQSPRPGVTTRGGACVSVYQSGGGARSNLPGAVVC